uniref:Uncharacterized protein n=1 Tax=Vespula pensylvanica TaxID=30213 RepID=A0A834UE27_VESPE|nr:hypothetical protein H0235_002735 [Vespula pensylvanica]
MPCSLWQGGGGNGGREGWTKGEGWCAPTTCDLINKPDFDWSRRGTGTVFQIPQNVRLLKSLSLSLFGRFCGIACISHPTHRLNRRNLEFEFVGVTVTAAMSTNGRWVFLPLYRN